MPDGNRIGDKAPLVTNSSEEDSHDEMSTREAEDEDDQVLIDLSQSDLRRNNSSNLWTSASQHTTGNSNSFQHSSGSTLRPYSAAHQQKSSVSTAATDMGEHSNAEDDSYRNNSSNLWTSASQHTTGNSNSFQHSSGSTLRPYSAAHQQKSSVSTAATDMGEHSNAEDDSYSSMDENKVMLKPHDESDMVSEAEEQLLQQAETKPKKQPGSFRKRVDSASSRIRQGSFVSLIGEERTGDNLITAPQCLMHLLKGMIGSGLLALPHAFSLVGIVAGPIYMAVICVIALVAMNFLVDANRHLCKVERVSHMDYGDLAECAIRHGPIQRLRRHSHWGKAIVNFLLILTQLGFCAIYFVFFAETVQSIMDDYDAHKHIDVHILITCFLLPVVLICLIRNLALLAVFSLLANVLLFGGLAVIVYELFDDIPSPSELPAFESITNIPLFFGTAIYCVEGIGLVLPLENKMRKPEQFKPVFNAGMVFVFLLYLLFGFLGYNKFHEDIQGSISYNLPKEWYFAATKVVFAIAMYVTYALQFVVPVRILMPWVNTKFPYGSEDIREYLFRLVLIMFTFIAAIAIPYLDKVINLLGSVASSSLALSLPAIIMELSLHTNTSISKTRKFVYRVLVVILVVVGVTGGIVGTVMSFEDIIKAFTAADSTHLINPTTIAPNTTMNLADYILNVGSQE